MIDAGKIFDEKIRIINNGILRSEDVRRLKFILEKFLIFYLNSFRRNSFQELKIEIRIISKNESKERFEVKSELFSDGKIFSSKKTGWALYRTIKNSIYKIKEELLK